MAPPARQPGAGGAAGTPAGRRIADVRTWAPPGGGTHYYPESEGHWLMTGPLASPLARYPGYETLATWHPSLGSVAVEVCCEDGVVGIGVAHGGVAACFVVEHAFAPLLRGADSADVAGLRERMTRASSMYGAGGLVLSAVSGIDLALWDIAARRADLPVAQFASATASAEVLTYATGPRPDVYRGLGFAGAKVDLPWGPAEGRKGLERNIEFLAGWADNVDPDFFLAVDCLMSLDADYAAALTAAAADLGIAFVEEPLLPWDVDALRSLRGLGVKVASGEHNTGRELESIVASAAVDMVQPELTWCGGMTTALQVADAVEGSELELIPHCGGIFSYHFAAACDHVQLAEFLFLSADGIEPAATFGDLLTGEPLPTNGKVTLTDGPGWGVRLRHDLVRPGWQAGGALSGTGALSASVGE